MNKLSRRWYIPVALIAVALISWDLATVQTEQVDYPLYRKLALMDHTPTDTSRVAIVGSDEVSLAAPVALNQPLTKSQIEAMVFKALDLQGTAAKILKPGLKILVKPNMVGAVADQIGENTDTRVVGAVVKYVHQKCGGTCSILIGEGSPRPMPYEVGFSGGTAAWKELWDKTGYPALIDELKGLGINVDTVNLNGGATTNPLQNLVERSVPYSGFATPQKGKYYIHKAIAEADVYITVPVLKIHNPGITAALKNQIGTAPGNRYGFNKVKGVTADGKVNKLIHNSDAPRDWTDEEIVDLCLLAGIDLVVVDATLCLEKQKSYSSSMANQVRMNAIVAGDDPVAVDHVCSHMAGINPDDVDHIALAELAGIGTNDPSRIEQVGTPVSHVAKRLKKSTGDARLMYGRSNRVWLLSGTYPIGSKSDPINYAFLPNESNYEATSATNGWSEPIYFFDDNIDLGNYYNYADDVVAYAFTRVYAPMEQDALLQVGSDEGMQVYLNHTQVYAYSGIRTYNYVSETNTIHLKQGYNTLLVKLLHTAGNFDFTLNICEPESVVEYSGNRVEGLKFLTSPGDIPNALRPAKTLSSPFSVYVRGREVMVHWTSSARPCLEVLDLQGKRLSTLSTSGTDVQGGRYIWNGCDVSGHPVKEGVYLIREMYSGQIRKFVYLCSRL